MPVVRTQPWPNDDWMTPEQLADAKARHATLMASIPVNVPFLKEDFTQAEEDAFYARQDRSMDGAVIAHRSLPASPKRR